MGGYGGRFAQWVRSENPQPYNSFGNGAAMRVSPVAHWFDTLDEVLDAAAATARPSHNHNEGIKGAQTVALAIFKAQVYRTYACKDASVFIDQILEECVEFSGYDINMPKASVLNRFDETCQGTVPVALKVISMATNYEDAVRMAVCLGADADTLGAIVGSIAEAIWGIPLERRMEIKKFLPDEMQDVIAAFFHACPRAFKPLIDTSFSETAYSEVAQDVLEHEEAQELRSEMERNRDEKRERMAERSKAREQW
jgi:ADP-ribosylglycohydrolase